jgi:hypothetical protein
MKERATMNTMQTLVEHAALTWPEMVTLANVISREIDVIAMAETADENTMIEYREQLHNAFNHVCERLVNMRGRAFVRDHVICPQF